MVNLVYKFMKSCYNAFHDKQQFFSLIGKGNGSKLTITCFGEDCGYNDETSFCFEVDSDVDEEVECYSPDDKCCAGGGKWDFPAGRTEPKCGSLNGPDTMIKCKTASGHMDSMSIFDGEYCFN